MSRIGRKPVPVPAGVKVAVADRTVSVEGPKGKLAFVHRREIERQVRRRGQADPRHPRRRRAPEPGAARPDAQPDRQHGRGRHRAATARGSRSSASATRRSSRRRTRSPCRSAMPTRSRWRPPDGRDGDGARPDPRSSSPGPTSRRSASSPPRSARSARRSRTRARASATRARPSAARKARPSAPSNCSGSRSPRGRAAGRHRSPQNRPRSEEVRSDEPARDHRNPTRPPPAAGPQEARPARPSARGSASSAARSTSTPRSSTTPTARPWRRPASLDPDDQGSGGLRRQQGRRDARRQGRGRAGEAGRH